MKHRATFRNFFTFFVTRKDGRKEEYRIENGITNAGINNLLDVAFRNQTQIAAWYIGLIDAAAFSALSPSDTLASHAGWAELTDYTGDRKLWDVDAAASEAIANTTTLAEFAIDDDVSIQGGFIASVDTGTSGVLWCTAEFNNGAINLSNGDTLRILYTVTLTDTTP